jgi:hypothetical protein
MKQNKSEKVLLRVLLPLWALQISGCSSSPVKVEVQEPDFKVLEAAPGGRESWLDTPQIYAEQQGWDSKGLFYYTGEAKSADKRLACEKAQANAFDDVGKQVGTFVDTSIARSASESSSADSAGVADLSASNEETQRISSQLSKAQVNNLVLRKQYWERRDYSSNGGPRNIYYCWALTSIGKQEIRDLVSRASRMRIPADASLKKDVENKLEDIGREYEEWKKTH